MSGEIAKRTELLTGRKPGQWSKRYLIDSMAMFDEIFDEIYSEMGNFRAVGFDVECVNFNNSRTFGCLVKSPPPNCASSTTPASQIESLHNLHLPVKVLNDRRSRKETSVLVQLATISGFVLLIRLCYLEKIPKALRTFLADPSILKLGVGIEVDACRLWNDWGVLVRSWLDLRHLCVYLSVEFREYEFRGMGLKKLATAIFGETNLMSPGTMKRMSFSDWTAPRLNESQLRYASWDAQIAVDIFTVTTQKLYKFNPVEWSSEKSYKICMEKCKNFIESSPRVDEHLLNDEQVREEDCEREKNEYSQLNKMAKMLSMFRPATNDTLHGHLLKEYRENGRRMCHGKNTLSVDAGKLFGLRSIGEREIVMADFDENLLRIYLQPSSNNDVPICVVCGEKDFSKCCLTPIVSPLYVYCSKLGAGCCCNEIWLCFECRNVWVHQSLGLTLELAIVFDAPIHPAPSANKETCAASAESKFSSSKKYSDSAAQNGRKCEKNIYKARCLRPSPLPCLGFQAPEFRDVTPSPKDEYDCDSHEYKVMSHFVGFQEYSKFETMWRQHFLELMQPQYLTGDNAWSVEHNVDTCPKKVELRKYFLHKSSPSSSLSDDEMKADEENAGTGWTTAEHRSSSNAQKPPVINATLMEIFRGIAPPPLSDIDKFFDAEQRVPMNDRFADDADAFDPLGFGKHVRSKQFDRELYNKLMQQDDFTLERYMDERSHGDELSASSNSDSGPSIIMRGNSGPLRRISSWFVRGGSNHGIVHRTVSTTRGRNGRVDGSGFGGDDGAVSAAAAAVMTNGLSGRRSPNVLLRGGNYGNGASGNGYYGNDAGSSGRSRTPSVTSRGSGGGERRCHRPRYVRVAAATRRRRRLSYATALASDRRFSPINVQPPPNFADPVDINAPPPPPPHDPVPTRGRSFWRSGYNTSRCARVPRCRFSRGDLPPRFAAFYL